MLGAQSVPHSTYTSAETTAPLADSSIHARLVKASSLVDHTHFKFVDYPGAVNFLLHKVYYTPCRCYSLLGSDRVNSATTVLEKRSQAPFAPGKRRCRVLDAQVHRPVENKTQQIGR